MLPGPVIVNSGGQPPSSGLAPSAAVYIAAPGQIGPGSIMGKRNLASKMGNCTAVKSSVRLTNLFTVLTTYHCKGTYAMMGKICLHARGPEEK